MPAVFTRRLGLIERVSFAASLACAVLLAPCRLVAQEDDLDDRTVARRMAEEAAQRYQAADYEGARDLFHRASTIYAAPTLALWEARALVKLGRLVEAEERYATVKRYEIQPDDPDVFQAAAKEAGKEIEGLRTRIPTLTIQLRGMTPDDPAVQVQVDSHLIKPALIGFPMPVDPGIRTIVVSVDKVEQFRENIQLVERDRRTVDVWLSTGPKEVALAPTPGAMPSSRDDLEVPPEPPAAQDGISDETLRTIGWVGVGVGAAATVTGIVVGQLAVNKHQSLEEQCPGGACPPEYHDDVDAFRDYSTMSTAAYVIGGIGLAAGISLLLTVEPTDGNAEARMALELSPFHARVKGRF